MLRTIISYIFPLTRKIKSAYNGYLELTQIDGKTFLNTTNANYSYGSLERVLKFSLLHVNLSRAKNILVLGLGGGCVIKSLRNDFKFSGNITAVDIDPVIIDIADKEFGISTDDKTEIICADAFDFIIKYKKEKFDLIIIDLFIDNVVPEKFLLSEFWSEVIERTAFDGFIVFNTMCNPFTDIQPIQNKLNKRGFELQLFRRVENTNKVLIAHYHEHLPG